jgi:hypothetical protein
MNLLKSRKEGAEGVREWRRTYAAELERRSNLEEERIRQAARPAPTSEEAEALAKAQIGARTAARAERRQQIESLHDFGGQVQQVLGQAENDRDHAIQTLDVEAAIDAARCAAGLAELLEAVNAAGRRSFGGSWS